MSENSAHTMEKPIVLNDYFRVVSYNGGAQANKEEQWGIKNLFNLKPKTLHCTAQGKNYDLVLEYVPKEGNDPYFSLTNLVIKGGTNASSPIKEGLVWISNDQPKIEEYASNYNDFTLQKFNQLKRTGSDQEPVLYFVTENSVDCDSYEYEKTFFPDRLVGRFLHFKWIRPTQGNNMDFDYLALVGYPGKSGAVLSEEDLNNVLKEYKLVSSAFNLIDVRSAKVRETHSFKIPDYKPLKIYKVLSDVNYMDINEKEKILAYGGADRLTKLWDYENDQDLGVLEGGPHELTTVHIRCFGDKVFSTAADGDVDVWDIKTRKKITQFNQAGGVYSIELLDDRVFCGDMTGNIVVYDLKTLDVVDKITLESGGIRSFGFYKDQIWIGCGDKKIRVYDMTAKKVIAELPGHTGIILCVAAVNNRVFSASEDKKIKCWDPESLKFVKDLEGHTGSVYKLVSLNGLLYSCSSDKTIKVWDAEALESLHTIDGHTLMVRNLVVRKSDQTLFSCGFEAAIRTWNIKPVEPASLIGTHENNVRCCAHYGDYLFTGGFDNTIRVWNCLTLESVAVLTCPEGITDLTIHDGYLYSTSFDHTVRKWDVKTFEVLKTIKLHNGARQLQISGRTLFVATEKTIRMLNIETGEQLREFVGHEGEIWSLLLVGKLLVSGSADKTARVWNTETGESQVLRGHEGIVYSLAKHNDQLFTGGGDAKIKKWQMKENGAEFTKDLLGHTGFVDAMIISDGALFSGSMDKSIRIWDLKTDECVRVLKGHTSAVFCLAMNGPDLYSGAADKTVRVWNLQLLLAKPAAINAFTIGRLKQAVDDKSLDANYRDDLRRNCLMLFCSYGLQGTIPLVQYVKEQGLATISGVNENGEDALYFAVKNRRWKFIKAAVTALGSDFVVSGRKLVTLLKQRALDDDKDFFVGLFSTGITFKNKYVVDILARSFLRTNSLETLRYWLSITDDVNMTSMTSGSRKNWSLLHFACEYAAPRAVSVLLEDTRVNVNVADANMQMPLHRAFSFHLGNIAHFRDLKGYRRSDEEIELARLECANLIINEKESSTALQRPKLYAKDRNRNTAYSLLLLRQNDFSEELKVSRKELSQSGEISHIHECFSKTTEIVHTANQRKDVKNMRDKFAISHFLKTALPYFAFLALLLFVALSQNRSSNMGYYFTQSIRSTFVFGGSPSFMEIDSVDNFYDWMKGPLADGLLLQEWGDANDVQSSSRFKSGHRLIGSVQLKQMRVSNESCAIPKKFGDGFVSTCYQPTYEPDKKSYGPGNMFKYKEDSEGETYWGQVNSVLYSKGGFIQVVTPNSTVDTAQFLETNDWIDSSTRAIFIKFPLYNVNLNLVGAVRLVLEFTAAGNVVPFEDVGVVKAIRYLDTYDYVVLAIELLLIAYFLLEFLVREIFEMRSLGIKYLSEIWNYYEWTLIILFFAVVGVRIDSIVRFNRLNLTPHFQDYVNLNVYSDLAQTENELYAALVVFCFLRALKFLVIPPATGPHTNSILQTMAARSFVVFIFIFVFVIITLALSFYLAFGFANYTMRGFGESIITMFRMLFGEFDYEAMSASNRVLAPVMFLLFFLFLGLVLMNLFIAVLSDVYINIEKQNESAWEIYITRLLIEEIKTNGNNTTIDRVIRGLKWIALRIRHCGRPQRSLLAEATNVALVEMGGGSKKSLSVLSEQDEEDEELDNDSAFVVADDGELDVVYNDQEIDKLTLHLQSLREENANAEVIQQMNEMKAEMKAEIAALKELILALSAHKKV
eukprot:TRINITY_DN1716_c0_g1_i1.p1 TRINITY_DN1716_c0_g1~~TRINITY_DN1716_c0_g1_i1.p1  ORF type:complete len:1754 (-),score=458.67 TRINITY_DN1716_c0_g1_i1:2672-7933(-)